MKYENKKDFFNSSWGLNVYDVWVVWISLIPQIKFRIFLFSLKIKDETLAQICDSQEPGCGKKHHKYDSPWILQKLAALWKAGGGGGNGCIGMVFPPASCLQSGSVVALCYLAFLGLVSHWRYPGKAACGEGMILEKMFDEVKDIFSCQCVALTNSVHHWRRKQSLWWEEKVGRRPASLQGEGRPSFTGRTCRTTADEPLLKTCKGNSPL